MDQVKEYAPMAQKVVGTLLSAKSDRDIGISVNRLAKYRAAQQEQNAGQQIAESTVAAQEQQRKSDLIASRAIAVAAASGGGVLDPTVVKILQGVAGEGALATATELYNGQEVARGMRADANATRFEGRQYKKAYAAKSRTTLLSGLDSIANTWGTTPAPNKKGSPPAGDPFDNGKYTRGVA